MSVQSNPPSAAGNVSERRFVIYAALIGCLAVAALMRELMARSGLLSGKLELFSSGSEIALNVLLVLVVCAASPQFLREMKRRRTTALEAQQSRSQIELLFNMTDMLQGALGHADANSVLRSTASSLLPGFGGALYIFNNSGDRLELSTAWQWPDGVATKPSRQVIAGRSSAANRTSIL